MKIDNNVVTASTQFADRREPADQPLAYDQNIVNRKKFIEDRSDPIFEQNVDPGIWNMSPQGYERGSREDGVTDRTQAYDQNAPDACPIDVARGHLLFDSGFFDKHHGYLVPDRVDE